MANYTNMHFGSPFKQLYHKIFGNSDKGKAPQMVESQDPQQAQGANDVLSQISDQGSYEIPADQVDEAQGPQGSALDQVGQTKSQGWGSWLRDIAKKYAVPITISAATGLPVYAFTGNAAKALATAIFTGAAVPPVAKAAKSATQAVVDQVGKLANPEYQAPPELPRFDQNIKDIAQQNLQRAGNPQDIYAGFEPIENRARDKFHSETIPSLAERFTAMGSGPRSSNFAGTLGQAGADFEGQLAALRSQYGQQQQALNSAEFQGLLPFFQKQYDTPKSSFLDTLGQNVARGAGAFGGAYLNNYVNQSFGNQPQINPLNPLQNQKTLGGGSNPTIGI